MRAEELILNLIEYAKFSTVSNYVEWSFYNYVDIDVENTTELDNAMENLEKYCKEKLKK